ncbi:MAG: hypothetical protein DRJ07_00240 [Bacteroidetes bacterium]|nr:MAG: hypothetical protein DRJ07_00240 [Bacteroidota bacterium]
MQKIIIITILLISFKSYAQLDVDMNKHAFQRTSFKIWDEWRPWWYFYIANSKYKKDDRRTMYTRARQMSQWAIYWDHYDIFERQTDSTYTNETYKALDRTLNKNWILIQRPKVEKLDKEIQKAFETSIDFEMELAYFDILHEQYLTIRQNIDITLDSYVADVEKTKSIHIYMEELLDFLKFLNFYNQTIKLKLN